MTKMKKTLGSAVFALAAIVGLSAVQSVTNEAQAVFFDDGSVLIGVFSDGSVICLLYTSPSPRDH